MSSVGQRIHDRRVQLGLSVDKLAEMLGKNRATIYRYESAEIEDFHISVIGPLAEALKTTPAYLMGWSERHDEWVVNFQKSLDGIISSTSHDDLVDSGIDIQRIFNISEGKSPVSLSEACAIAEQLGCSLDEMVGLNKSEPTIRTDSGLNEIALIFSELSPDNRSKLLELSRLYLDAQKRNG